MTYEEIPKGVRIASSLVFDLILAAILAWICSLGLSGTFVIVFLLLRKKS